MTKNLQPLKGKYTNEKTLINIYNDRNISKISKLNYRNILKISKNDRKPSKSIK